MSLTNSNTYIEPVSGTSLNGARGQFNNSLRSILTNFRSAGAPIGVNVTASGAAIGEQDGMLYRSTVTNALYISDSDQVKSSPVGGNFTRVGIGNRVENGIDALAANAESYEIGELVATVSEDGVLAADARLYLCTSNALTNGSTSGFLDVGAPQGYSVGTNDNVTFSGQSVSALRYLATTSIGIGTTTPEVPLHIEGSFNTGFFINDTGGASADIIMSDTGGTNRIRCSNGGFVVYVGGDSGSATAVNSVQSFRVVNNGDIDFLEDDGATVGMRFDASASRLGIGVTAPSAPLHVQTTGSTGINIISSTTGTSTVRLGDTDNASAGRIAYDNSINALVMYTGGAERANVNASGMQVTGDVEATNFNSTSDARLKENVVSIRNALNKTLAINGVYYNLIDSDKKEIGVIAQNVETVVPEVVHTSDNDIKSVSYSKLTALLIEAIKEQNDTINSISNRLKKIENTLSN